MEERRRPRVIRSATEVPAALIDEVVDDMAARMAGTDEARHCAGLSFAFVITGRRLPRYRYAVGDGGTVTVARDAGGDATFTFTGDADTFDAVLRGQVNALRSLLTGGVHLHGSLWHIRGLLRMMPAVERSYTQARTAMVARHQGRYDFRF